jgi:hypothetical protein
MERADDRRKSAPGVVDVLQELLSRFLMAFAWSLKAASIPGAAA